MNIMKQLLSFLFICGMALLSYSQQPFDARALWQMKRVGSPVVSPDGSMSVFTVTEYDTENNSSSTDIYLVTHEGGAIRQLTFSGKEGSPAWSPDGRRIAFTSRRNDGSAQVYVLDLAGGEARKVTDLPVGVFGLKWFPDGRRLAFAANILPDYGGDWDTHRDLQKEMRESKVTAKVTENVMYRYWDRWLTEGYYPRLFSVEIHADGASTKNQVVDLMPNTANFFGLMGGVSYDISPDGAQIAVSMNATEPPYENTNHDIFLLPTDGSGEMTNITSDNPANDSDPVYSPDGRYILYGRQSDPHFYADRMVMTVYDRQSGSHRELTSDIDLSCQNWFWSSDGNTIYFLAEDRAMQSIFSIPARGGRHTEVFRGGTNSGASFAGPDYLVFSHHHLSAPSEIVRLNLRSADLQKLTGFNDAIVEGIEWGRIENVTYKGADGVDIQMFINYPPGYDPSKKYPLVLMIHGGPHGIFGDQFHFRWNSQLFASPGYIAAMPNFHGSTSFGQDFAKSIHGEHANKPFEDIMKATDYLIERGLVDETRMAATGGSYGGYMVSWIAGHTDRYACLVNHAGVYDLHLQFASDFSANREHQYGGSPWENYDILNLQNPSQFAQHFKSPMLVIHGELDYRVPVAHGFMIYNTYRLMGLDARLVYYPDENHWILTPQNSIFWYDELYGWLERYLK